MNGGKGKKDGKSGGVRVQRRAALGLANRCFLPSKIRKKTHIIENIA